MTFSFAGILEQQPGWEPDLNDGVRLKYSPIVETGVLRSKFNIKWVWIEGKPSWQSV